MLIQLVLFLMSTPLLCAQEQGQPKSGQTHPASGSFQVYPSPTGERASRRRGDHMPTPKERDDILREAGIDLKLPQLKGHLAKAALYNFARHLNIDALIAQYESIIAPGELINLKQLVEKHESELQTKKAVKRR